MNTENRSRIIAVYGALEELAETVVFVGGATLFRICCDRGIIA